MGTVWNSFHLPKSHKIATVLPDVIDYPGKSKYQHFDQIPVLFI